MFTYSLPTLALLPKLLMHQSIASARNLCRYSTLAMLTLPSPYLRYDLLLLVLFTLTVASLLDRLGCFACWDGWMETLSLLSEFTT